ncbi:MAG: copper transporter [Actinomycetota bacterium]|nr:copper transporter [Actinomycetota bacterium]
MVLVEEVDLLIDFRFFIIAIVAVFLSLGLGIVLGSGFIGDPILRRVERNVETVLSDNEALEAEILDLEERIDENLEFMNAVEPVVLEGQLASEQVVLIQPEGADRALREGVQGAVEAADGRVASVLTLNNKLALEDEGAREDLATALESGLQQPGQLRNLFASELAMQLDELTDAARPRARRSGGDEELRAAEAIERLVNEGFLSIDGEEEAVPTDAGFVILTGSPDQPEWAVQPVVETLATTLGGRRSPLVVAETSDSTWGVVADLRLGDVAETPFSTVDNGETPAGRVAIALALDEAPEVTGHWGLDDGAAAPVPTPSE